MTLPNLIETEVTKKITTALEATKKRSLFSAIFGDTGRSKTLTCKYFVKSNNDTILIELTGACSHAEFIETVAYAVLGKSHGTTRKNKHEIVSFLKRSNKMLIIDETNQLFFSASAKTTAKSLEFIRRNLYELSDTPVMLVFTSYTLKDLRHGSMSGFLEQFRGRIGYPLQLPKTLLKTSEVKPIVLAYEPTATQQLIDAAIEIASPGDGKLRTLVKYLDLAAEYCEQKGGKITPQLLLSLRDRYEDGGIWTDDEI